MGKIKCKLDRFGVIRNEEGSILNSSVNIGGIDISTSKLADWFDQCIRYYIEEIQVLPENSNRRNYLVAEIKSIFIVLNPLLHGSEYDLEILPELALTADDDVILDIPRKYKRKQE